MGRFVYGRRYLERPGAVELDRFELPRSGRQFETPRRRGMFGALHPALAGAEVFTARGLDL